MNKISLGKKIFLTGLLCLLMALLVWNRTENRINSLLSQINSGLERIAQVKTVSNEVTRNQSGQLLWQGLEAGEVLFVGNSIQTENNSSTEIIFDDGAQVLIGPQSLVRFVRADDKISLELINGKIEVKGSDSTIQKDMNLTDANSRQLFISTPRGSLKIDNSVIRIQAQENILKDNSLKDNSENFKIEVVKGAPELISASEKKILKISTDPEKITVEAIKKQQTYMGKSEKILPEHLNPETPRVEILKTENKLTDPEITEQKNIESPPVLPEAPEDRQPAAQTILKAPKVKSIKIEAFE